MFKPACFSHPILSAALRRDSCLGANRVWALPIKRNPQVASHPHRPTRRRRHRGISLRWPDSAAEPESTSLEEDALDTAVPRAVLVCLLALRLWPAVRCAQGHGLRAQGLADFSPSRSPAGSLENSVSGPMHSAAIMPAEISSATKANKNGRQSIGRPPPLTERNCDDDRHDSRRHRYTAATTIRPSGHQSARWNTSTHRPWLSGTQQNSGPIVTGGRPDSGEDAEARAAGAEADAQRRQRRKTIALNKLGDAAMRAPQVGRGQAAGQPC